jgi:predicted AAA+ superfamily ATPase
MEKVSFVGETLVISDIPWYTIPGVLKMVTREHYMKKLRPFVDKPLIKVISGMRRSGKSIILKLLREELLERKIPSKRIIYLDFESRSIEGLAEAKALYTYIASIAGKEKKRVYILLDEIQIIPGWEKTVASFRVDFNCDIYITGSNSSLLGGGIAALLAGRFVEIRVYPLSFREHLEFTRAAGIKTSQKEQFIDYLRSGGMPGIHEMGIKSEAVRPYLQDIYNSVLLKDVIARNRFRDTELLERIIKFLMDNTGNIFSAKSISNFLKNQNRRLSTETVYHYLAALESAYLIEKVSRWDINGKRRLETREKYFLEDFGLKHAILGYREADIAGLLENIVYLELIRRGYQVYIGQTEQREVDFIAQRQDEKIYLQVAYLLASTETIEREFAPFFDIKDNYPKYVLSLDEFDMGREGIQHRNIRDWLLDG